MSNERLENNRELTEEEGDFVEPEVRLYWDTLLHTLECLFSDPFNCYSVTKQVELYRVSALGMAGAAAHCLAILLSPAHTR